ncbi:unnamed protein product [Cladocopium goreaui]|uniref:Adenylosuccinate synthetase n=1 Tax=Cladocopium goreaui TaxID=2562237 RepID=A0A9P1FE28_9DINO|nr:unnamed protein product [Cladocopium goreaui]
MGPRRPSDVDGSDSPFCVVLGAQWGDEGKGKLVDILAQDVQVCARFNGGANAGHTLLVDGKKYAFHLLPCGMINKACKNLIGNGVVVHIPTLMKELDALKEFDPQALERVFISTRAHILLDSHQVIDGILEAEQGSNSIGTTKRGIGPCYSSKAIRNGVRFGDLLHFEEFERKMRDLTAWSQKRYSHPRERDSPAQLQLRKALREYNTRSAFDPEHGQKGGVTDLEEEIQRYKRYAELLRTQIVDSVTFLHSEVSLGSKVLVEGANAALLDVDFGSLAWHGMADFGVSSFLCEKPHMALLKGCSLRCLASRGRRFFADVPKAVQPSEGQVTPTYPQVYGRVEETVMSPYKGGPVYLWLRSSIVWLRRFPGRHWMRWIERNSDYQKMCLMGMPEFHIDPTKNRWRYYIDTSYYGGMLDKSHEDFYRYILLYPAIAFFLHCTWCRIKDNDKDNFLAKWRVPAEEACTYPFVTSSNTTVGSVCTGLGVPPKCVDTVIGVVKAYTTRVGHGPFPTELQNEMQSLEDYEETFIGPAATFERKGHTGGPFTCSPGQPVKVGMMLQEVGAEYGTTTGRRRRCGWLDLALVKYSALVNGFDSLNITKLDVLTGLKQIRVAIAYRNRRMTEVRLPSGYFPSHLDDLKEVVCEYETLQGWAEDISHCTSWEELPVNARKYVERIEELLGIPVSWVGVGPDRNSMLKVPKQRHEPVSSMLPQLPPRSSR